MIINVVGALTTGSSPIEFYLPSTNQFDNIDINIVLGSHRAGTATLKKCEISGYRSGYSDPLTPYDFQSRQNYRNVELRWNISAEDNLMYLSGTIPTAGLASSSKMLCLFDTDSTFKYSLNSNDLEKSEASLVSLVGEKGDSIKISKSTYIPKQAHWFSHLSPPKPIPRPVVDLLRYEVDIHPRTSVVTFAFSGNAPILTIWENTKINVVLGKLKSGSSSHLDCELKALTQQDVIVNSIETKQEATYYKTFSLDYNVDPVTRLMILSGTLPTFGMRQPKIVCYFKNSDDFVMEWEGHLYIQRNQASLGSRSIIINGYLHRDLDLDELETYNLVKNIELHPIDGATPFGLTLTNTQDRFMLWKIVLPELIVFKELESDAVNTTVQCTMSTRVNENDTPVETHHPVTFDVKIYDETVIIFRSITDGPVFEAKISCPSLTPVSHYYRDEFMAKWTGGPFLYFPVYATTHTVPPHKDDPPRPKPPTPDPNPDEPTSSAFHYSAFLTAILVLLSATIVLV